MRILITGAVGLVGRTLVEHLGGRHELRLLDHILPEEATVYAPAAPGGRAPHPWKTDWPLVCAEVTDAEAMRAAAQGMDAIVHLAGLLTGYPDVGVETFRVNALGTFMALDAARLAGVKRVLCASSINAFGTIFWRLSGKPYEYESLPLDESLKPVPEDPYSRSKYVNEETCAAFHRAYGMTTAAFRFAGVWSPETYEQRLAEGIPPTTTWSEDLYQWVHVVDIADGLARALECPELPGFGVYTLSAGDTRCPEPTMELVERFRPEWLPRIRQPLEGRAPLLSIDRARRAFGYAPRYRLGS